MTSGNPIVLLGTAHGVFRLEDDTVSPLSSDRESVRALQRIPGGELLAGTDEGGLFASRRQGVEWHELARIPTGVASLVRIPGTPGRLAVLDRAGGVHLGAGDARGLRLCLPPPPGLRPEGATPRLLRHPISASKLILVDPARDRPWASMDAGDSFAPHGSAPPGRPHRLAIHSANPRLWLLGLDQGLARSKDEGQRWELLEQPRQQEVQAVELHRSSRQVLAVVAPPAPDSDPLGPSALWLGEGRDLQAVPRGILDSQRDPSGEILCAAWSRRNQDDVVLLGTDRGEVLLYHPARQRSELLTSGLPSVQVLLPGSGGLPLDPEGSGIHLLP